VLEKGKNVFEYVFLMYCMETTFYEIICEYNILEYSTLKDNSRDFTISKDRRTQELQENIYGDLLIAEGLFSV